MKCPNEECIGKIADFTVSDHESPDLKILSEPYLHISGVCPACGLKVQAAVDYSQVFIAPEKKGETTVYPFKKKEEESGNGRENV